MRFLIVILAIAASGCATEPWERFYKPNPAIRVRVQPTKSAEVREVPYERVRLYFAEMKGRMVSSSVAIQDMPADERNEIKNRMLETFQLPERGDEANVLGWAEFTNPGVVAADDGTLEAFARSLGADYAVFCSNFLGEKHEIVQKPVVNLWGTLLFGRRGGVYLDSVSSSVTVVPTEVTTDQYYYLCIFVRRDPSAIAKGRKRDAWPETPVFRDSQPAKGWEPPKTYLTPSPSGV